MIRSYAFALTLIIQWDSAFFWQICHWYCLSGSTNQASKRNRAVLLVISIPVVFFPVIDRVIRHAIRRWSQEVHHHGIVNILFIAIIHCRKHYGSDMTSTDIITQKLHIVVIHWRNSRSSRVAGVGTKFYVITIYFIDYALQNTRRIIYLIWAWNSPCSFILYQSNFHNLSNKQEIVYIFALPIRAIKSLTIQISQKKFWSKQWCFKLL